MYDSSSCIKALKTLQEVKLPNELLSPVVKVIEALEEKDMNKTIFAFDELICDYCIGLIDKMGIECHDTKSMFPYEKYKLAGKKNLLDAELYSIWQDFFYVVSSLCTNLDFGTPLPKYRLKDGLDCIYRFAVYLKNKYS